MKVIRYGSSLLSTTGIHDTMPLEPKPRLPMQKAELDL